MDWAEQPIGRQHDRQRFNCGVPELNEYLQRYARQNHVSGGAKTFVAVPAGQQSMVMGYYSIAPGSWAPARVPSSLTVGRGHYELPVFRLARLAVDVSIQRQGLGAELLLAAGARALAVAQEVGGVALAIDAKDDSAARWYQRFGAVPLRDDPRRLILPLQTIHDALRGR